MVGINSFSTFRNCRTAGDDPKVKYAHEPQIICQNVGAGGIGVGWRSGISLQTPPRFGGRGEIAGQARATPSRDRATGEAPGGFAARESAGRGRSANQKGPELSADFGRAAARRRSQYSTAAGGIQIPRGARGQ